MTTILILEMILFFCILLWKYLKYHISILFYASSWFVLFYALYFIYPAICLDSFVKNDNWQISVESISCSKFIVFLLGVIFIVFYAMLYFPKIQNIKRFEFFPRYKILYQIAKIFIIVAFMVISFALVRLISVYKSLIENFDYLHYRHELELIRAQTHLKIISYLLLGIFYYIGVFNKRIKLFLFFLFLELLFFEFLSGTRTTMFFIVIFIYLTMVRHTKNGYLKVIMFLMIIILFSSNVMRSIGLQKTQKGGSFLEKFFEGNGEFNNTFITLPYVMEYRMEGTGSIESVLSTTLFWIPPLTRFIDVETPGNIYQNKIDRGIGYASSFITNGIFYFNYIGLFIFPIMFLFLLFFDNRLNINSPNQFLFKILMICFIRNFCREGTASFFTFIYIFIVYFGFFMILEKKGLKKLCIN